MIKVFLTLMVIVLAVTMVAYTEDRIQPVSSEQALKNVQSICLGKIIGDPIYLSDFTKYLNDQLVQSGIVIKENPNDCDAILTGHLKVLEIELSAAQAKQLGSPNKIVAWAWVKMIDKKYQTIWTENCYPYTARTGVKHNLAKSDYVKNDGRSGCAENIVRGLTGARKKLQNSVH